MSTSARWRDPDWGRTLAPVKRILVEGVIAVPIFIALAWWNSAVAVLFGIAALAWILGGLYWRSQGGDIFRGWDQKD